MNLPSAVYSSLLFHSCCYQIILMHVYTWISIQRIETWGKIEGASIVLSILVGDLWSLWSNAIYNLTFRHLYEFIINDEMVHYFICILGCANGNCSTPSQIPLGFARFKDGLLLLNWCQNEYWRVTEKQPDWFMGYHQTTAQNIMIGYQPHKKVLVPSDLLYKSMAIFTKLSKSQP